jgi:hypothetical protein
VSPINKSDRNDAAGIARIMQTGWFKEVRLKGFNSHAVRALLTSRAMLVKIKRDLDQENHNSGRAFTQPWSEAECHSISAGDPWIDRARCCRRLRIWWPVRTSRSEAGRRAQDQLGQGAL